ncbi:MAG: hypothetical protein DWH75_01600 [Planctomycetota bacterium]|nr:MAG: hypothetical protein DWH75_01600 [Planctomycetota bacterium]
MAAEEPRAARRSTHTGDLRADAGDATKTHVVDAGGIDDQQADHDALRRHGRRLEPEFRIEVAIMDGGARKRTQDNEDLETKTDGPGTSRSRRVIIADIVEFVAFEHSRDPSGGLIRVHNPRRRQQTRVPAGLLPTQRLT